MAFDPEEQLIFKPVECSAPSCLFSH